MRFRKANVSGTIAVVSILAGLIGCAQQQRPAGSPLQTVWEEPPTQPQPVVARQPAPRAADALHADGPDGNAASTRPADVAPGTTDRPIAFVNGKPIGREQLVEMLIDSHGMAVLEQLILLSAARQKAASMGLSIATEDVAAAEEDALRRIASPVGDPESMPLDRPAAEQLLAEFLRLKGLSRAEWKCRMEQLACIRKIAEAEIAETEITDEMLENQYDLAYGERVQIRHIQASSHEAIARAVEMLEEKPFEEVAREISENALTREKGGLMPPFTRHDGAVPPLIREQAFSLPVGEVSEPLREGAFYHLIRVEKSFPASGVGLDNVDRDKLRQQLIDRLVRQRTDALDAELFQAARIDIRDEKLARQFRRRHQERQ